MYIYIYIYIYYIIWQRDINVKPRRHQTPCRAEQMAEQTAAERAEGVADAVVRRRGRRCWQNSTAEHMAERELLGLS